MLHILKQASSLARDLICPPTPAQILNGNRMFRPFLNYQHLWLSYFYPKETLSTSIGTWPYLQKFMMPLIKRRASSYHLNGINKLSLDCKIQPDFCEFSERFYNCSDGFELYEVTKEIEPITYFSLICQRKFPCINLVRAHEELFCANEPDFWHEAIGHIAPLCDREVQEFYIETAHHVLASHDKIAFNQNMAVAWTLLEYGFIKQHGLHKMFGAALVGSHLAHMRYQYNNISIEAAVRAEIISSGFYTEHTPLPRNHSNKIRFFSLDRLSCDALFI